MQISEEKIRMIVRQVLQEQTDPYRVPIGVSNHHIHLSDADFKMLFPNQEMKAFKPLKQPGEYATEYTADLIGPAGTIEHVRVLGPNRSHSQVEIARSECFTLGIDAPIRLSGHLDGAPTVKVRTKDGEVSVDGLIVAKRHIHMSLDDAARFGVKMGDIVSVEIDAPQRHAVYSDVVCRPRKGFVLEMHLDTDEASAANVRNDTVGHIIPPKKS